MCLWMNLYMVRHSLVKVLSWNLLKAYRWKWCPWKYPKQVVHGILLNSNDATASHMLILNAENFFRPNVSLINKRLCMQVAYTSVLCVHCHTSGTGGDWWIYRGLSYATALLHVLIEHVLRVGSYTLRHPLSQPYSLLAKRETSGQVRIRCRRFQLRWNFPGMSLLVLVCLLLAGSFMEFTPVTLLLVYAVAWNISPR